MHALSDFVGSRPGLSDGASRVCWTCSPPTGGLMTRIPPREKRHLAPSPLCAPFQSQLLSVPLRFFSFRVSCLWRDTSLLVLVASEPGGFLLGGCTGLLFAQATGEEAPQLGQCSDASARFPVQREGGAREPRRSVEWRPVTPDSWALESCVSALVA